MQRAWLSATIPARNIIKRGLGVPLKHYLSLTASTISRPVCHRRVCKAVLCPSAAPHVSLWPCLRTYGSRRQEHTLKTTCRNLKNKGGREHEDIFQITTALTPVCSHSSNRHKVRPSDPNSGKECSRNEYSGISLYNLPFNTGAKCWL